MAETSANEVWQVEVNGTVYEAPFAELGDWIDGGSLLPDDKVRRGNLRWIEAKRVPSLVPYFNAKEKGLPMPVTVTTNEALPVPDAVPTVELPAVPANSVSVAKQHVQVTPSKLDSEPSSVCLNHADVDGKFICTSCGVCLCRDCVRSYGSVRICSACGSMCKTRDEIVAAGKASARSQAAMSDGFGFADFAQALSHPFQFKIALFLGGILYMLFSLGQSAAYVGGIFLVAAALVCLLLANMLTFGVLSHTVNSFAKGDLDASFMPDYEDFSLWDDVVHPFFLSIAAYLVSFGPFILTAIIGGYIVFSNVSNQMDAFKSDVERIPGTNVYTGRELTEQSGDVQEVLKKMREKEAQRVAGLTETAENGTQQPVVDQESLDQEKLWAEAMDSRKKQLEGTFGKTAETQAMERQAAFQALMKLAAPLVVVGFITLIWGLFFFPAASAVAGYTRSFVAAINPLVGIDTIRRLGFDYIKILLMGLLLMVIAFFVSLALSIVFAAFAMAGIGNLPAQAIGSFITFYFWVVFCCILGYALFKNSEKLKLLK